MRRLRFGDGRTHRDHRVARNEGANPVLDTVDGRVRVTDGEFRQHHLLRNRHRGAVDTGGAHEVAVGRLRLVSSRLLCARAEVC